MDAMLHKPLSTGEFLIAALSQDRDRPALILGDGTVVTIGEMADLLGSYVAALDAAGLAMGARVGVLSRNRPEVVHMTNALSLANLCMVPLHPMGAVEDFIYVAEMTGLDALIFDPAYFDAAAAAIGKRCPGIKLYAFGKSAIAPDFIELVRTVEPAPFEARPADPEDISRMPTTGGTTGKPKAIMLSQRAMTAMLVIQMAEWDWPAEVRTLICAPLSHSGVAMLVPTLLRGGTLVVADGFDPEKVLAAIEMHRITCTLLVPTMIYALLDHPRLGDYDISSLESVYYGAASINPERLAEAIRRFGPIFYQFYGQSEAPMTVTVMRRHEHDPNSIKRLSSCGRPVPWLRVKLLDSENREVADGEPGEICCQGPLVMTAYLNNPSQTTEAFDGGWLHTGDVAVRDPDGFLRIIDRKKDMIITGGFNVYPREIEDVISEHPAVAEVSVVGLPDPKWGEKVVAFVVCHKGQSVSEADLIAAVRERKGPVQAPKTIMFGDAIPLSALGKPDKKAVRVLMSQTA